MTWYIGDMEIVERNYALVVTMFLFTSLAFIILVARLYTRAIIVRRMGADDYLMVAAFVASIGFFFSAMYQIKYGLGRPVNFDTLVPFLHALYSTVPCYNIAQTAYKLSIAIQSYRLFSTQMGIRVMKALIGWIIVCGIMSISASFFYCSPVAKAWDDSIEGWCVNRSNLNYAVAGFNILNDIFLLCIPFPFLVKLQVAHKQRVVLMSVFACGVIVTIVSIVRLKALYDNLNGPINLQPVTGVDIALWSDLEINVAIICGSVPALKALIGKVFFGLSIGDSTGRSGGYGGHTGGGGGYGASSQSRKQSRNQSHALRSQTGDDDEERGGGKLTITVQQSIEMKSYLADDTGSEKELITAGQGEAYVGRNGSGGTTRIDGGVGHGRRTVIEGKAL